MDVFLQHCFASFLQFSRLIFSLLVCHRQTLHKHHCSVFARCADSLHVAKKTTLKCVNSSLFYLVLLPPSGKKYLMQLSEDYNCGTCEQRPML